MGTDGRRAVPRLAPWRHDHSAQVCQRRELRSCMRGKGRPEQPKNTKPGVPRGTEYVASIWGMGSWRRVEAGKCDIPSKPTRAPGVSGQKNTAHTTLPNGHPACGRADYKTLKRVKPTKRASAHQKKKKKAFKAACLGEAWSKPVHYIAPVRNRKAICPVLSFPGFPYVRVLYDLRGRVESSQPIIHPAGRSSGAYPSHILPRPSYR